MSLKIQKECVCKRAAREQRAPKTIELPREIWALVFSFTHFSTLGALRQSSKSLQDAFRQAFLTQPETLVQTALQSALQQQTVASLEAAWKRWDPTLALWPLLREAKIALIGESVLKHISPLHTPKTSLVFAAPYMSRPLRNTLIEKMRQLFRRTLCARAFDYSLNEMHDGDSSSCTLCMTIIMAEGTFLKMDIFFYSNEEYPSLRHYLRDTSVVSLQCCSYDGTTVWIDRLADTLRGVGMLEEKAGFLLLVGAGMSTSLRRLSTYHALGYRLESQHGSYETLMGEGDK